MTALTDIPLKTIGGRPASLEDYAGQVLLVVNTASQCGLTPQYAGLQALYQKYRDEGFAVLGFPANDFAGQEPGSDQEIAAFCETGFGVSFPMFAKIGVLGPDKHPLYRALIDALPGPAGADVTWNFEKFLVGRDGEPVARFAPRTAPDDPALVGAIERELFASE